MKTRNIRAVFCFSVAACVIRTFGFSNDVVAFYPFCDGVSGAAAHTKTLTNAVDGTRFAVTSSIYAKDLSGVRFSDDVPGKYLFDGTGFKETRFVESYASVEVWGRKTAAGAAFNGTSAAELDFAGLATELAAHDSWTVEFFYKMNSGDFLNMSDLIAFDAGYSFNGVSGLLGLGFYTSSGATSYRAQIAGNYNPGGSTLFYKDPGDSVKDTWHHLALVFNGETGVMTLYHDHSSKSTATFAKGEAAADKALILSRQKGMRGKYCALRVTGRALTAKEMLHASDCPTQVEAKIFDYPLEGAVGSAVESDKAVVDGSVSPVYTQRRPLANMVEEGLVTGTSSNGVCLSVTPKAAGATFATGPGIKCLKSGVSPALDGSFTMEGYFKFNRAVWEEKVITGKSESRPRMTIMGQDWVSDGRGQLWSLRFDRASSTGKYTPAIDAVYVNDGGAATTFYKSSATAVTTDGKWHRYVVTYDQDSMTFVCYEDDQIILTATMPGKLMFENQGNWYVGTDLGNHPFEGEVDAVRLTRGALPLSKFRVLERVPSGLLMLLR